ncbi:MAG: FGGY family carbohydrate kinase [Actinomycetota bacterium]|nr:FGGY family carbohydrate kinase [Actinomycetota bacterium]MDA3015324.1 FGGY family carbohydrate kinase [Actinomycetota bacterium]MDA3027851.1 FGGY family carbohydrate kinase [Actinomycetota bacterium]
MTDDRLVLGVAVRGRSCSAEVRRVDSGALVDSVTVAADGDGESWTSVVVDALHAMTAPNDRVVSALSCVAPAQTAVLLDGDGELLGAPVPAADPSTVPDAGWLSSRMDAARWRAAVGSVPHYRWTLSALSLLHRCDPDRWAAMAQVATPAEFLGWRLTGVFATEPGDASSTGCWSADGRAPAWDVLAIVDADRDWSTAFAPSVDTCAVIGSWHSIPVIVGTNELSAAVLAADPDIGDVVVLEGHDQAVIVVLDAAGESADLLVASDGLGRRFGVVHPTIDLGQGLPVDVVPDGVMTSGRVLWVGDGGLITPETGERSPLSLAAAGSARAAAGLLGDTPTTVVGRWAGASVVP